MSRKMAPLSSPYQLLPFRTIFINEFELQLKFPVDVRFTRIMCADLR